MRTLPIRWLTAIWTSVVIILFVVACGGAGNDEIKDPVESGTANTTLRVDASDANGDGLSYQWRVTAGSISNKNSKQTVWTLPLGPGAHFAYVLISDGKGGYVEQQYVVSTDGFKTTAPVPSPAVYAAPTVASGDEFDGNATRMRLRAGFTTTFASTGGAKAREVYLPGVQVVVKNSSNVQVFAGETDIGGELVVPRLAEGNYSVTCTTAQGTQLDGCFTSTVSKTAAKLLSWSVSPAAASGRNLLLFGHIGFQDGGVCGLRNELFGVYSTASVQLLAANGTALTPQVKVNGFGDYALDASVVVDASLKLKVVCEGFTTTLDVPAMSGGYSSSTPLELSYVIPNSRPTVTKMAGYGPDGNLRGEMVTQIPGAYSVNVPGFNRFLSFKGLDTRLSGCLYYRSFGAVQDCDSQGNMVGAISLNDWLRENKFGPWRGSNTEVSAIYINQRDLNLVRRMTATQVSATKVAFYVCNHPGPETDSQSEIDLVVARGLADEKMVACVAMEYSPTTGRSGGNPFTKFLIFGPGGKLMTSVNLDGRGEKFVPGACVACHGGASYVGRFGESGHPTPDLGAKFLPFDTGNYLFSGYSGLTEAVQSNAIYQLNQLVKQTGPSTATTALIDGWYAAGPPYVLDKSYVPTAWSTFNPASVGISATSADAAKFYHEVVGTSCRTCHVVMPDAYDWDAGTGTQPKLVPYKGTSHICGNTANLYNNGIMPNALMSLDRLRLKIESDAALADLMTKFLGCTQAAPDPVYPRH
ncbi:MAG: hypothetical protein QM776_05630 [Rhodocyclaceae bacterium]